MELDCCCLESFVVGGLQDSYLGLVRSEAAAVVLEELAIVVASASYLDSSSCLDCLH